MPGTGDLRFAEHRLLSLLVVGGFPFGGRVNAFPPPGLCLALLWWVTALQLELLPWPCAFANRASRALSLAVCSRGAAPPWRCAS